MKLKSLLMSLTALASAGLMAGSAQAVTIAGWDFSQYYAPGALTIDGVNGANTLPANYSKLDPTSGAGAESAAYGTMYMNGEFGSSAVDPFASSPAVQPIQDSLVSNINAPVSGPGTVPFDTASVLMDEGQTFFNYLSMAAAATSDLVFNAHVAGGASEWGITLGGKTLSGTSLLSVSFSLDGASYSTPTLLSLDTNDKPFSVSFGPFTASSIFVRLNLPVANGTPVVDNVSLNATLVPEPTSLVLFGAALAAVAVMRRRSA